MVAGTGGGHGGWGILVGSGAEWLQGRDGGEK